MPLEIAGKRPPQGAVEEDTWSVSYLQRMSQ